MKVCQLNLRVLLSGLSLSLLLSSSPVWSGFACLENPCFHGICIDYLTSNSSHQCYCRNGFTGYSCQMNWDECRSNPCLNGGLCTDGIASFNCSCPDNFAGALCEYDLSACDELFPCQNNGTCTVDPSSPNGTLVCNCPPGFSGGQCESDVSICNLTENVCRNGGRCVDGLGVSFICDCESGWSGKTCEVEVDECASQPCQNGGICVDKVNDFSCACPFGYTGKACESKLKICEENPCLNGAFCLHEDVDDAKRTCYCVPDYHGTLCELKYDDCDPHPKCFNGGTCVDGVGEFSCSCPPLHFGATCQCSPHNSTHPECNDTSPLTPPPPSSEFDFSRSLEATTLMIPPPTSFFFQLSTTLLPPSSPSSVIIHGEDLTSSHTKPLGSAFVSPPHSSSSVFQSDSAFISVVSSSLEMIEGSLELTTPTASNFSGDLLHPTPTAPVSSAPLVFQSEYVTVSSAGAIEGSLELTTPTASNFSGDLLHPNPTPVFTPAILPGETETVTLPPLLSVQSEDVAFSSPSLFASSASPQEETFSSFPPVQTDLVTPPLEASPTLPLLTISEVTFHTASVVLEGSSLLFSEAPLSSSYETEVPHKDILSSPAAPPSPSSLSVGVVDSEKMSSAHEDSAAARSSLVDFSLSPLVAVSSEMGESVWMASEVASPSREPPLTSTLLEASPSSATAIEDTASFHLDSSKEEESPLIPPSASSWEDVRSSAMRNVSVFMSATEGGAEESSGVFTPALPHVTRSRQPHLSLTPTFTATPTPSHPEASASPTVSLPPTDATPTDLCTNFCLNGATCSATSIRPECTCSFKFTGERCEIPRPRFRRVSFSGDSFIGYRVPNESVNRIEVGATVATNFPEGILFYTSVGKLYALIFLQEGHATLHFSCGQQSMHFVETRTRVDNAHNFTLAFTLELVVGGGGELSCVGQVSVNGSYVMRGEQSLVSLNGAAAETPSQSVFLGGVPASSNALRNDELIGIMAGLRGCLYSLSINGEEKDLFEDAVEAQGVSECSAFECAGSPCYGHAKCVPSEEYPFWECLCPPGFEGSRCQIRVCESKNPCRNGATCTYGGGGGEGHSPNNNTSSSSSSSSSLACLCPLGFGGLLCQSKLNITKPSFRPTFAFDYSAFIAYAPIPHFVEWVQLKFHFVTPNTSQVALLVYSGGPSLHPDDLTENYSDFSKDSEGTEDTFELLPGRKIVDFFALTFVHGYITLTWNLGSGTQRIITPGRIDRRLNIHTLFAGRSGRVAWLKVDGMRNVSGKSPGPFHRLNGNSELFVGGHEAFRLEGLPHDLPLHKGFHGCIFDFGFRVKNRLYLPRATRGRNVQNCYEEDC